MEIPDPLAECARWWVRKLRRNGEDPAQALHDNRELEALGEYREMMSAAAQEDLRWLLRLWIEDAMTEQQEGR